MKASQPSGESYSGMIVLEKYLEGEEASIEFENGSLIPVEDSANREEICGNARQVMYCAAERIDDMNWLDKGICYLSVVACVAQEAASCMVDGCPK